jgi:hypothetical protein
LFSKTLPVGWETMLHQWRTQDFFRGGVQQIQLTTEGRENGDLGAVAP